MTSTGVNTSTMLPVRQLRLGFLRRNLTLAPKETKVAAYKALVRFQLEYAAPNMEPPSPNRK